MMKKIKIFYKQEQFHPRVLGIFINPFYFARRGLYAGISVLLPKLSGRLLDIGCGTKPYENLCSVKEYIGLEIDDEGNRNHSFADVFYDGESMPFEDKSFDSILCNQVFEHVFNPDNFLHEINRVTKIGGQMLMSVPFVWDEHEQPYDYARYSSFGLRYLLEKKGFKVLEQSKSNNGFEIIFQLINGYIFKITLTNNKYFNLLTTLFLMAPVNIFGLLISKVLPRNDDLYLDNILLIQKVKDV